MIALLTGTKKNAGDFLIAHAAKRLLARFADAADVLELPAWKPLGDNLARVNECRGLILCGGPAIQPALGRSIYPILDELDRVRVPIIAMGVGWKGIPGDDSDVRHYVLPDSAKPLLRRLAADSPHASCRDEPTRQVLLRYGVENALLTGCPAWYDLDHLGKPLVAPERIERVVFTPAEHPAYFRQCVRVMQRLREQLAGVEVVCSFHRGWTADQYTRGRNAECAAKLKAVAESCGFAPHDISGGLDGIAGYDRFDMHIGYRVHAHFKLLSQRRPSLLIAEDGRGRGAREALGGAGVSGWRPALSLSLAGAAAPTDNLRRLARTALLGWAVDPQTPTSLADLLAAELETDFPRSRAALSAIDATWPQMERFLAGLPR